MNKPIEFDRDTSVIESERRILEMVATGAPLAETLAAIAHLVESQSGQALASILLYDPIEQTVHVGAAPSLPSFFNAGVEGQRIGPQAGSCGTAIFRRAPVSTPNIAHDSLWEPYRALALKAGLAASWSTPLIGQSGQVLGSLAHYYMTPQDATPHDMVLTDIARHLAEIAIQRSQTEAALREHNESLRERVESRTRELVENERLLNEAQALAHLGSWMWDVRANVVRWSDELYRIYGVEPNAFGATLEAFLAQIHIDDRDRVSAAIGEALKTGGVFSHVERIVRPSGEERILASSGRAEVDEDGRVSRMLGICLDITERRRAEEDRSESERRAREAIAEAAAAHELNRLKTLFVNLITHELSTPLTAILGYLEFLEEGIGGPVSAGQKDLLCPLNMNVKQLRRLVDDLLDHARMEAGTFTLKKVNANLLQVVRDVVADLQPVADAARVKVVIEAPEQPAEGHFDPQRIAQVVGNLLANALKFGPKGGTVHVKTSQTDSRLHLAIADEGPGIAADDQHRLFQAFSQLEGGVTRGGTGLGLAISKNLVEAHGGLIGLDSAPTQGATFWFELPRA